MLAAAKEYIKTLTKRKGLMETQPLGLAGDEAIRNVAIGTEGLKPWDPVNESGRKLTMEYVDSKSNESSI